MPFVYHMVPKGMQGTILYPLNTLKTLYPEVYAEHVKKYAGRMELLDRRIERLDCLWNDVLHCSALNPSVVVAELRKLGRNFPLNYFEIPAEKLEPENTVVYLYSPREKGTAPPQSDFVEYDPKTVGEYAYLPDATVEYYKEMVEKGLNPLGFHLVPHILYKGKIDITDLRVISI